MQRCCRVLLACAAVVPGFPGLRVSRNGSAALEPPATEAAMLDSEAEIEGVPSIEKYREIWTKRYKTENHTHEPLTSEIQLILGVFTVPREMAYRQVMRETWMQQEGVCFWSNTSQANCTVYSAFVVGNRSSPRDNMTDEEMALVRSEEGILPLDISENMNNGKSVRWLATALQMFPWATHIGKMDSDTYPFIHKLIYRMSLSLPCKDKDSPYEFIGRPARRCAGCKNTTANFSRACRRKSKCATQFRGRQDDTALGQNWHFMSGQLYILSLPLVEKMFRTRGSDEERMFWKHTSGFEDRKIAEMVDSTSKEQKFCVMIKRPDAWYHRNSTIDANYANNFEDEE